MNWIPVNDTCPNCGSVLHEDPATGDIVCLECEYEK